MNDRIELETTCRQCLRKWIPTYQDVRAGRWRVCPRCRVDDPEPLDAQRKPGDHEEGQEAA